MEILIAAYFLFSGVQIDENVICFRQQGIDKQEDSSNVEDAAKPDEVKPETEVKSEPTRESLLKESRKFNLDLAPKVSIPPNFPDLQS